MSSLKPTHARATDRIPPQRNEALEGSLTQARVDAIFRALVARREYERGVARMTAEQVPPVQRESQD